VRQRGDDDVGTGSFASKVVTYSMPVLPARIRLDIGRNQLDRIVQIGHGTSCQGRRRLLVYGIARRIATRKVPRSSAREIAGQREGGNVVGVLAAIDLQVFENPMA